MFNDLPHCWEVLIFTLNGELAAQSHCIHSEWTLLSKMVAWQHSWFSPYLQGGEARLGLLLLSLDIVSSLKLQAEIIRALINTEKTWELHSPTAELVPPLHSPSPVL